MEKQEIILGKIELHNVKGIKDIKWDFWSNPILYGTNGIGKTTILEAAYSMLADAGLNSKTYRPNSLTHGDDFSIKLTIYVNIKEYVLERTNKKYYINGMPLNKAKYYAKIDNLVDTKDFTMAQLMNPNQLLNLDNWKIPRSLIMKHMSNVDESELEEKIDNQLKFKEEVKVCAKEYNFSHSALISRSNDIKKSIISYKATLETVKSFKHSTPDAISLAELEENRQVLETAQETKKNYEQTREFIIEQDKKYQVEFNKYTATLLKIKEISLELETIHNKLSNQLQEKCVTCGQDVRVTEAYTNELINRKKTLEARLRVIDRGYKKGPPVEQDNASDLAEIDDKINYLNQLIAETKVKIQLAVQAKQSKDSIDESFVQDQLNMHYQLEEMFSQAINYVDERSIKRGEYVLSNIAACFPTFELKLSSVSGTGKVSDTFEIFKDGIPLELVNTAMKKQIKFNFLTAIQRHLGLFIPIFIDELEAIVDKTSMMGVEYPLYGAFAHSETNFGKDEKMTAYVNSLLESSDD